ncbi:hypothetical protein [Methylobacterium bullatum]|uniref:Uncharacterized protein n=1 Tax=Methylobacterium bullatum TaxID=570505 RepID=A0A679KIX7_9HYPH|nr:hypothetical protein MBLL_04216 [Methylobacterium bullatum]
MNQTYQQGLRDSGAVRGPSNIRISGANRPSDEQVDNQLLKDLSLLMDAFMENAGQERADFHFDEITDTAVDRFRALVQVLRQTGDREHSTTFRDLTRGETFTRSARITTQCTSHPELGLNVPHVGEIEKVGKTDPLIFGVDVVTNHL